MTTRQKRRTTASPISVGNRYNMLVVIQQLPRTGPGHIRYLCKCDCGHEISVRSAHLMRGQLSCGCITRIAPHLNSRWHGNSAKPEYKGWCAIIRRCTNPSSHDYKWYGARGITVDERWLSFEKFALDMGPKPSPKHQLDRINNALGYAPSNCRWVLSYENNRNRRSNKLTFNDVTDIRVLLASGVRVNALAKEYGCGWSLIGDIKLGRAWGAI